LEAPALHTLRLIVRQTWRHCVTSLHSAHRFASSLKLAARCPVRRCWPSCFTGRMPLLPPNQQCQSTEGNLFKDFQCLENLEKNSRTFKVRQECCM